MRSHFLAGGTPDLAAVCFWCSQHVPLFGTSTQLHQSCRFTDDAGATHCPRPAENWALFVPADPHAYCVHATVHDQLDCRAITSVSFFLGFETQATWLLTDKSTLPVPVRL